MAGSIICGVDDSESAKSAARVARALAGELGLGLVFVRVVEPDAPDAKVSAVTERLERLSADATDVDCGAAWLVEAGHPADRLVAAAKKEEAALVVVGSTGPRSSLLGSISADVSRRAPCPVVVVPPGADARVDGHRDGRGRDDGDTDDAGGLVRFALGGGSAGFAGGIVRFGLAPARAEAEPAATP
jgi:nucleotide-binding universal stress UspA family protein